MVKDIKQSLISFFSTTILTLIMEEAGEVGQKEKRELGK